MIANPNFTDGSGNFIAFATEASQEDVEFVLNQDVGEDSRGEFFWLRLASGDLVLCVSPMGETYEEIQEKNNL